MQKGIHREMTYKILEDFPIPNALQFLLKGIAKKEWEIEDADYPRRLQDWIDMPDSNVHLSRLMNDHSYKLDKNNGKFKIEFARTHFEQSTVVARLTYSSRGVEEWQEEDEYRACALELAKSLHWVVDMSSPSHVIVGWDKKLHTKLEEDFDDLWGKYYDKGKINFKRKNEIKNIYKWAKQNIENSYKRNSELLTIYSNKGTIKDGRGSELGKEVIQNLAQNVVDYLHYINKKIDFDKLVTFLN